MPRGPDAGFVRLKLRLVPCAPSLLTAVPAARMAARWAAGAVVAVVMLTSAHAADALSAAPLAPRSGPRGATMFAELSSEQTGIVSENRYADPLMWAERFQVFTLGPIGTGIAAADYDNDGKPDLYIVSKTEGCRLFRNLGNWKFADVTERAGLAMDPGTASIWKQGACFADVNNDGCLDIYLCRFNAPNLLYINQGNGTFKEEGAARGLAIADASGMAAFCDYDRDGWLDVYLQTNMLDPVAHPGGQRDLLFHNNRDGTFADVTSRAGITGEALGHSATWWDYDGDQWPDLYVANDFSHPDSLYRNNRDGTFSNVLNSVVPHTPFSSMAADFGDINNDGLDDFLVADMAATSHEKDQRGMAESRLLNKENAESPTEAPQYMRNALYLNTGLGRCLEVAQLAGLAATDWTWALRFEDLDNDGRLDLRLCNGMVRELHNLDLLAKIMTSEDQNERVRIMRASPVLNERNLAYRNLGDLTFADVGAEWGLDQKGVSFGAAFADFDGDGDLDLVYSNYQSGVTVLRNDSDTGRRLIVALRGSQSNRFGVGATVRIETPAGLQTRTLVITRGYLSSSEPILHFGLGDQSTIQRLTVTWPSGHVQTFTDLAADQKLTIVEPSAAATIETPTTRAPTQFDEISNDTGLSFTSRERLLSETTQQTLLPLRQNRRGPAAAVGDLNGDGLEDLATGGTPQDPARVFIATAAGTFTKLEGANLSPSASLNDGPLLIFDSDGDGANDLLVTRAGTALSANAAEYQPKLLLGDGHGQFHPAAPDTLPPLPISVGAVAAADFDRDGHVDVFIGGRVLPRKYPLPARSALLVNRGGKFADVTDALADGLSNIGLVTSALWSDVDGDGWLDLLVSLDWGGIHYFHNDAGQRFTDLSTAAGFAAAGSGWWTSLASADFNGDGHPDYVCGNLGLNTPYRADSTHPALIYYGDFKGGGSALLVEGSYDGDRIVPRRTRTEFAGAVPEIKKKLPRNDAYARATLAEIVGGDRLAAAQRFAATELRSGVFLSQLDGTYRFNPLPRLAQVAPCQGLAAGDFDGDGFADIYAVQNSYSPIPYIGRFDGGVSQLLRGDGHGNFLAVPPNRSGLLVPGDAKALVVTDLDANGWPDFVVTRNNSSSLAFKNRGFAGHHSVRVSLRGAVRNLPAIGARCTFELHDGTTQQSEIFAGAGYFSQSSASCFFGYADGNPPKLLRVRWPNGTTSEHPVPGKAATMTVDQP